MNFSRAPHDQESGPAHFHRVRVKSKKKVVLPIGRTARIACVIEDLRAECCKAAGQLAGKHPLDEMELDECAQLDDALASAHRLLKASVGRIILSRLRRRSRRTS